MILTSTVFDRSTGVTDTQTYRQTDGFAIAYSALSMLSRAKNAKISYPVSYLCGFPGDPIIP